MLKNAFNRRETAGGLRFAARLVALFVVLLAVAALTACSGDDPKPDPVNGPFSVRKALNGYTFLRGDTEFGHLEAGRVDDTVTSALTGDISIVVGDKIILRMWTEESGGTYQSYLTTPEGTSRISAWTGSETKNAVSVREGDSNVDAEGLCHGSLSFWVEYPSTENRIGNILLSISEDGKITAHVYQDVLSDGEVIITVTEYTYELNGAGWDSDHCLVMTSRQTYPSGEKDNFRMGTMSVTVDRRDGETAEQLSYTRFGLGNENGVRYRLTCTRGEEELVRIQTLEDAYERVRVEDAYFSYGVLFRTDADGKVADDLARSIYSGQQNAHRPNYNGLTTSVTESPLASFDVEQGGLIRSILLDVVNEYYEGAIDAAQHLTSAKYRKHTVVSVNTSENAALGLTIPVACGEWLPLDEGSVKREEGRQSLLLHPVDTQGWDLYAFAPEDAWTVGEDGETTVPDLSRGTKVGEVRIGMEIDDAGRHHYTGEVTIRFMDGTTRKLMTKPSADPSKTDVVFVLDGNTVVPLGTLEKPAAEVGGDSGSGEDNAGSGDGSDANAGENAGETNASRAADDADDAGDSDDSDEETSGLVVRRYVELPDYSSSAPMKKLFYEVLLPDGHSITQFMTTNDGAICVRLFADEAAEGKDNTILYECRFVKTKNGIVRCENTTKTVEVAGNKVLKEETAKVLNGNGSAVSKLAQKLTAAEKDGEYDREIIAGESADPEISLRVREGKSGPEVKSFTMKAADGADIRIETLDGQILVNGKSIDQSGVNAMEYFSTAVENLVGLYSPVSEWASGKTEHFTCRVMLCTEFRAMETTLDGTELNPARRRLTAWLEITDEATGERWSVEIGTGNWKKN